MAGDFNQFTAIGRLTNDPERKDFPNGGAVVNFGFATTGNSRWNQQSGRYENEPMFVDCKAFIDNQGKGIGDVFLRFTRKGSRVFITARLVLEKWRDGNGNERRAHRLVIERMSLLDGRQDGGGGQGEGGTHAGSWDERGDPDGGGYGGGRGGNQSRGGYGNQNRGGSSGGGWDDPAPAGGGDEDIPF